MKATAGVVLRPATQARAKNASSPLPAAAALIGKDKREELRCCWRARTPSSTVPAERSVVPSPARLPAKEPTSSFGACGRADSGLG